MTSENQRSITTKIQEGIFYLTLDRPPLNVMDIPMLEQLESSLEAAAKDEAVRVLVLEAQGKVFSAGVDVADHTPDKVDRMIPLVDGVCRALADFPVPTIAVVHGHALGGGCELVLCCDLAVMAESATIGQPEIQLAMVAPVAALRLPYLVGYRVAAELMLSGRRLAAGEALQAGLVNAVVPQEQVSKWALEQAKWIAGLSQVATRLVKQALRMGFGRWAEAMPEMERLYLEDLMNSQDAQEGLAAFMEKRRPVWKHR